MNCVNCQQPMLVLELDEVEIDHCVACGGIWLDAGELEALLGNPREIHDMMQEISRERDSKKSTRKCPICLQKMESLTVGKSVSVRLDKCSENHGFWFDRGELQEVMHAFDTDRHSPVHHLLKEMFKKS